MYKDSEQVSSSLVRSGSDSEADLYTLTLGGLTEADYGNYSCVARNNLGTGTGSVMITGELSLIRIIMVMVPPDISGSPDQPVITSPRAGAYTNTYKLIWTVWTPASAKILNQSILYRRIKKVRDSPSLISSDDDRCTVQRTSDTSLCVVNVLLRELLQVSLLINWSLCPWARDRQMVSVLIFFTAASLQSHL